MPAVPDVVGLELAASAPTRLQFLETRRRTVDESLHQTIAGGSELAVDGIRGGIQGADIARPFGISRCGEGGGGCGFLSARFGHYISPSAR